MKYKALWKISIATTREAEEAVAEALGAILNRVVSSYFNVKTGRSTVSAFCEGRPATAVRKNISAALQRIRDCGLKIGPGSITITKLRREDWAESWKRHFKPVEIKVKNGRGGLHEPQNSFVKAGTRGTRPSEGY